MIVNLIVLMMDNRGQEDPTQKLMVSFFENMTNYFNPDENRNTNTFNLKLTAILNAFAAAYGLRYWKDLRGYPNADCPSYDHIPDVLKRTVFCWHAEVVP